MPALPAVWPLVLWVGHQKRVPRLLQQIHEIQSIIGIWESHEFYSNLLARIARRLRLRRLPVKRWCGSSALQSELCWRRSARCDHMRLTPRMQRMRRMRPEFSPTLSVVSTVSVLMMSPAATALVHQIHKSHSSEGRQRETRGWRRQISHSLRQPPALNFICLFYHDAEWSLVGSEEEKELVSKEELAKWRLTQGFIGPELHLMRRIVDINDNRKQNMRKQDEERREREEDMTVKWDACRWWGLCSSQRRELNARETSWERSDVQQIFVLPGLSDMYIGICLWEISTYPCNLGANC